MSTGAYWQPSASGKVLSEATKFIFRDLFGEKINVVLDCEDIKMLRAITVASKNEDVHKDVETLIGAIEQYERIKIFER